MLKASGWVSTVVFTSSCLVHFICFFHIFWMAQLITVRKWKVRALFEISLLSSWCGAKLYVPLIKNFWTWKPWLELHSDVCRLLQFSGYDVESVLGKELGPLNAYVRLITRKPSLWIGLEEISLWGHLAPRICALGSTPSKASAVNRLQKTRSCLC